MPDPARITVFLLDDHEIVRRGIRDLLEAEGDIEVVGEASTADQAVGRVHGADVAVARAVATAAAPVSEQHDRASAFGYDEIASQGDVPNPNAHG